MRQRLGAPSAREESRGWRGTGEARYAYVQSQGVAQSGRTLVLKVDWENPETLTVLDVESRDSLYPFTGAKYKRQVETVPTVAAERAEEAVLRHFPRCR
jgi:hypothetical protein